MPKKQTKSKKLSKKTLLVGALTTVALVAVVAQLWFNLYTKEAVDKLATLETRLLIKEALQGLQDLKSEAKQGEGGQLLIPEARLKFPAATDSVADLLYLHHASEQDTDSHTTPETIEVTTTLITKLSFGSFNASGTVKEVFDRVPEAQACSRGMKLQFVPVTGNEEVRLRKKITLNDGRTLYVYREKACNVEGADALEAHVLKAQSY